MGDRGAPQAGDSWCARRRHARQKQPRPKLLLELEGCHLGTGNTRIYINTHTHLYTHSQPARATKTMQLLGAGRQLLWGRDAPTATCYKKWQKITLACRCFVILTPATPSTATSHSPTNPIPVSVPLSVLPTPTIAPAPVSFCNSLYALFTLERIVAHLPRHKWEFWALASDRQGTVGGWGSWWWV